MEQQNSIVDSINTQHVAAPGTQIDTPTAPNTDLCAGPSPKIQQNLLDLLLQLQYVELAGLAKLLHIDLYTSPSTPTVTTPRDLRQPKALMAEITSKFLALSRLGRRRLLTFLREVIADQSDTKRRNLSNFRYAQIPKNLWR